MFRILDGGSLIGFYFILGLLVLLLGARAIAGLKEFIRNRKRPLMTDQAVVLDKEALPGGLVVRLSFATLHNGALSLEMTEKEAKLFREGSRGNLTWQGTEYRSFKPERN